jgi:hypothetical protein
MESLLSAWEFLMRRFMPLLLVAVLLTLLIPVIERGTHRSLAQEDRITIDSSRLDPSNIPGVMIDGSAGEAMALNSLTGPLALVADDPADRCQDAPEIFLYPESPADGVSFDTEAATSEPDDPVLSCMWGNPSRPQGYRTVWYKLIVPASGRISLDTFSSGYDTVLGVYSGDDCSALTPVRCEDDSNGFSSATILPVTAGETYYIEIADWQPGIPDVANAATLNFTAFLNPIQSRWEQVSTNPTSPAISRHATVAYDGRLYVIGGQSGGEDVPFVSNRLLRLNVINGNWREMAPIPGAGYSNNTAALVNGRIYVPSGYNGNDLGYDGLHWVYDIAQNFWQTVTSIPSWQLPGGKPFAWSASAVPPSNDRYFLMGGTSSTELFDSQTASNDEAYVYLVGPDTWLPIESMQTARYAHTASWVPEDNLGACVAGGLGVLSGGVFVFHSSAECYDPVDGVWRWIGNMNIPRIGAGSVTGPDGKWYVFGGLTAVNETDLAAVLQTEVYDPVQNTWTLLPPEFNLGGQDLNSARGFPAGSMIGNMLYVTGGSIFFEGEKAVQLTEKLLLPTRTTYAPVIFGPGDDSLKPDDTFAQARGLAFGQTQSRNFQGQRDFFDVYTFNLNAPTNVQIQLQVPDNNDFDLFLYGQNKLLWDSSTNPFNGQDEFIPRQDHFLRLEARRYYVVVERKFPTAQPDKGDYYQITLRRQ